MSAARKPNSRLIPPDGAGFLGGHTPVLADFFVFESFDTLRLLLPAELAARLDAALPRLVRLRDELLARPGFARCQAERPANFTGRPDEPAVIARLHACAPDELWPTPGPA